jgi:hypothetical protein
LDFGANDRTGGTGSIKMPAPPWNSLPGQRLEIAPINLLIMTI